MQTSFDGRATAGASRAPAGTRGALPASDATQRASFAMPSGPSAKNASFQS